MIPRSDALILTMAWKQEARQLDRLRRTPEALALRRCAHALEQLFTGELPLPWLSGACDFLVAVLPTLPPDQAEAARALLALLGADDVPAGRAGA